MKTTRRSFMKAAAVGVGAVALSPMVASAAQTRPVGDDEVGMLYDSTLCVGCKACVHACRSANFDLDPSSRIAPEDAVDGRWFNVQELDYRTKNIIKMYVEPETDENKGKEKDFAFIKRQCNHCSSPGCVSACPVKAMTKNPVTGIVEYDKDICLGCRYCMIACPFNVPCFEWHETFPKITKCELCRETNLKTKGMPACVEVCPTKAVIYGKRNDLLKEARSRIEANPEKYLNKIYGERDYGGTNVIYLSRVDFEKLGLPSLPEYSHATISEGLQHKLYRGLIAPGALYVAVAAVAWRNSKKKQSEIKNEGGDK